MNADQDLVRAGLWHRHGYLLQRKGALAPRPHELVLLLRGGQPGGAAAQPTSAKQAIAA